MNATVKSKKSSELYNAEIAGSERLRALILIGMLGLEAIFLMIIYFFYRKEYLSVFNNHIAIYAIFIFTAVIIIYESIVHHFIGKKRRVFFDRWSLFGYINAFSEITLLTLLFIFIIEYSDQPVILQAPATLTYFLFIILSTLRLNPGLSVYWRTGSR